MPSKKINITVEEKLLDRMDTYAQDNGLTRSALIALSVTQYLNAVEAMPSVHKLLSSMAAVAEGAIMGEMGTAEASKKMEQIKGVYEDVYLKK